MDLSLKTVAVLAFIAFLAEMLSDGAVSRPFVRRLLSGGDLTRFVLAVARFVVAVGCLASLAAPLIVWVTVADQGAGVEWLWVACAAIGGLAGFCLNAALFIVFVRAVAPDPPSADGR